MSTLLLALDAPALVQHSGGSVPSTRERVHGGIGRRDASRRVCRCAEVPSVPRSLSPGPALDQVLAVEVDRRERGWIHSLDATQVDPALILVLVEQIDAAPIAVGVPHHLIAHLSHGALRSGNSASSAKAEGTWKVSVEGRSNSELGTDRGPMVTGMLAKEGPCLRWGHGHRASARTRRCGSLWRGP